MSTRNKTLRLKRSDITKLSNELVTLSRKQRLGSVVNKVIHQDMVSATKYIPEGVTDVLILDPPYNLSKDFNGSAFKKTSITEYAEILELWIQSVMHTLKPNASIYICGDWHSSTSIHTIASKYFNVRSRITWEREKGRGALSNWKNCSEDIWFCTMSKDYHFNTDAVKLRRRVIAPYRNADRSPKDWQNGDDGKYRLTFPSNLWTDITVPFWSMSENTDHPTQKPEKLIAKLILASSEEQDVILDPFLGSGTTAVTAYKLNRNYIGIEQNKQYCCMALKRLQEAERCQGIQGYAGGVFWERNSIKQKPTTNNNAEQDDGWFSTTTK